MMSSRIKQISVVFKGDYPAVFFRLLVGAIFVFSAVTKLPMHSDFTGIVRSYHLLPDILATAYGVTLPWIELVAGSFLVLGIQIRPVSLVTLLVAISFLAANISSIISGNSFCGNCFGEVMILHNSQALVLDIAIIIITVYLYIFGRQPFSIDSLFTGK